MDTAEFRHSLAAKAPPAGMNKLAQALWHDAKGDWNRAHEIVQSLTGKAGARVHAYLHRKEGDLDNAGYWYERAGTKPSRASLASEWQTLVSEFLGESSRSA